MTTTIDEPCAWVGSVVASSDAWVRTLTASHIDELHQALQEFASGHDSWQAADRTTFPLPGFESLIEDIRRELENGMGMVRLSGLPVERYSDEELGAIWGAIGHHLGTPVSQSLLGERQMRIEDVGAQAASYGELEQHDNFRSARARAFSTARLRFHTDRCDVVGLLCVRQAAHGGDSRVASAVTIHNVMLDRHPDLVDALYTDYPRSRFGEEEADASVWYSLPVFAVEHGKFTTHYSRTYVEAAQTNQLVPRLTEAQYEAIDVLAEIADEVAFDMTFAAGDMQFLNNHVSYHARDEYEDDQEPGRGRLLLRQWLAVPNSRQLPEAHAVLFGSASAGSVRGGIWPVGSGPSTQR